MNEKQLHIKMPQHEYEIISAYAVKTGRTKSDIVREFIRSLEAKLK
jgi:predicted DNA-binding protein